MINHVLKDEYLNCDVFSSSLIVLRYYKSLEFMSKFELTVRSKNVIVVYLTAVCIV